MCGIGSVREKLDGASPEICGVIPSAGAPICGKFPAAEECRVSEAAGRTNVEVLGGGKVTEEIAEDGKGDWLFGFVASFSVVVLDATDEALNNRGFCG